jgi:hypothetical protein
MLRCLQVWKSAITADAWASLKDVLLPKLPQYTLNGEIVRVSKFVDKAEMKFYVINSLSTYYSSSEFGCFCSLITIVMWQSMTHMC